MMGRCCDHEEDAANDSAGPKEIDGVINIQPVLRRQAETNAGKTVGLARRVLGRSQTIPGP